MTPRRTSSGTEPSSATPKDVADAQRQLRIMQWVIPALTGTLVVISAFAGELATWLASEGMEHIRGAPCHPQTQGKIERWHQTLKNRVLLENHHMPGDLQARIEAFVTHYNHQRCHESLSDLTPADVYFGRGQAILLERERIKQHTIRQRRLLHQRQAA